jgi:hypothetical protein
MLVHALVEGSQTGESALASLRGRCRDDEGDGGHGDGENAELHGGWLFEGCRKVVAVMRTKKERRRGSSMSYRGARAEQLPVEGSSDLEVKVEDDCKAEQEMKE